ncbi:MAG: hypothetical protein WC216_01965 [Gallionella sp.]
MPEVHLAAVKMNHSNDPEACADIKHYKLSGFVSGIECITNICECTPRSAALCQASIGFLAGGCLIQKSTNTLREMMCMAHHIAIRDAVKFGMVGRLRSVCRAAGDR